MTEPRKRVHYEIRHSNQVVLMTTGEGWTDDSAKRMKDKLRFTYNDLKLYRITKTDDVEERVE